MINCVKRLLLIIFIVSHSLITFSQDTPPAMEEQLESIMNMQETKIEDDSYLQQLAAYRKDPVNLNTADRNELTELGILNDLQIENLISYRRLLGPFIDIYELQAIPSWNIPVIRRLLPFIAVAPPVATWNKQFSKGEHTVLMRMSQKILLRYRYQYKNLLQYGVTGNKDVQEQGPGAYSFHLFVKKKGMIQSLALGDFTVNMAQGLIQWQSLAFKKSAEVMGIKRQSPVLRPYNSAGDNFHRGAGVTLQRGKLETTTFISFRKLSAGDRQIVYGGNLRYRHDRWHVGINAVHYKLPAGLQRQNELYDLFAPVGDHWYNVSIDYNYLHRNLHVFGEAAIDKNFNKAMVNGILLSVDPKIDLSILHRMISKEYQAIQGNAFTENTGPSNENGLYAGMAIRPASGWRLDAYADIYRFPWLKYLIDKPSSGRDLFIQLTYTVGKQAELYTRFRNESKTVSGRKQNWRTHINYKINPAITLRKRIEVVWYNKEAGFLAYADILYKPLLKPFAVVIRLQYFETDGYATRLYAYENDVLYSYSIPAFYDKGYRYAVTMQYDFNKKISCWLRWAQTLYDNETSELKLQGRIIF